MTIARIAAVLVAALALFACSKAPEPPPAARSDAAPAAFAAVRASRACDRVGDGRRRRCVREGEGGRQAALPLLGCGLVPAVQRGQGDDLHAAGFHRARARVRAGLRRRRREGRAEARHALQGQRLSDDGPVHAGRPRDHAAPGRGRGRPLHAGAGAGDGRCAAGARDADRCARQGRIGRRPACRGLAHARVVFVDHRREAAPGR